MALLTSKWPRTFAVNRYRRAVSVACVKAHAKYVANVVNRESPVRLKAATYNEFRERDMQYERDAYNGKHPSFQMSLDKD